MNGVEDALDPGDGRLFRYHAGVNPLLDCVASPLRDPQQLDPKTQFLGIGDVVLIRRIYMDGTKSMHSQRPVP